jgi:hypothetical protein
VSKHPLSRSSLGAVVRVAKLEAPMASEGLLQMQFCSIACLRQYLLTAVDELERRAAAGEPQVNAARERVEAEAVPGAASDRSGIAATKSSRSPRRRGR